jgi:REP element-mobilizing transposase RayT
MGLYKNKYRTESIRVTEWDYSSNGYYFVTICTKNQECFFGNVIDSKVVLTSIGEIARQYWQAIPEHFQEVKLDEFIVVPNHLHGIVIISNVETCHGMSLQKPSNRNIFTKPLSGPLSTVINQYKCTVTRECRKIGYSDFSWQSRFYEHIIRNEKSLQKIRQYIMNNPVKWELDEYHPDRLNVRKRKG